MQCARSGQEWGLGNDEFALEWSARCGWQANKISGPGNGRLVEVKPGFCCAGQSGSERFEPPEWGAIQIAELLDGYHRDNRNLT